MSKTSSKATTRVSIDLQPAVVDAMQDLLERRPFFEQKRLFAFAVEEAIYALVDQLDEHDLTIDTFRLEFVEGAPRAVGRNIEYDAIEKLLKSIPS